MVFQNLPIRFKNPTKILEELRKSPEKTWIKKGEHRALRLFQMMAEQVPAYRKFLKTHRINPSSIKTIKDFRQIPTLNKDNYLRKYPLPELCWNGEFKKGQWIISTTSGSTGEPYYFPRTESQNLQYAALAELYLRTNFSIDKKSTLYINTFPMGAWIGGIFTHDAITRIAKKNNYALSIINPGIHKQEILKAVKHLGGKFEQIIIGGYGPFLKDFIEDGTSEGLNWKQFNIGLIFSAEGFTEEFRDYVAKKVGIRNVYRQTLNHYGTVDLGTMSYETPISILIRRIAICNDLLYKTFFGNTSKLPTFTQYFPELFYFEEEDERLVCSAFSGLPLVRYDLKDNGRVLSFEYVINKIKSEGINIYKESKKANIEDTIWKLPFVHVYERSDFSVSLYAFQIYPETIRRALQHAELEKVVTGKFTMMVKFDRRQNQYLEINVELKKGVRENQSLYRKVEKRIIEQLLKECSEYRETYRDKSERIRPKIVFWRYEDTRFFKPGVKQKWVKK
jgi:phenylacetate-CoA ligase